jgi:hypothetical protein
VILKAAKETSERRYEEIVRATSHKSEITAVLTERDNA